MKKQDQISFASTRASIQKFKIVMVGDQNAGKSSIIIRYVKNDFDRTNNPTIGIDFTSKNINIQGKQIRLQLWDTAGQQRFRSLIPSYLKDCNLALVVFDVTSISATENLQKWIDFIRDARGSEAQICITGNKIDLEAEIQKDVVEQARKIAKEQNLRYFEVSALTGANINEMFLEFAEGMLKNTGEGGSKSEIKEDTLTLKPKEGGNQLETQKPLQPSAPISLKPNPVGQQPNQTRNCC